MSSPKPRLKTVSIMTEFIDHADGEYVLVHTPEGTVGFRHDDIQKMATFFTKAAEYIKNKKVSLQ